MKRLIITDKNELKEVEETRVNRFLLVTAKVFSYVFHPIFIPVYVVLFLLYISPFLFVGFTDKQKILVLAQSLVMYTFFPLITVLLLKALKFIDSIQLNNRKDRIIPFVVSNIWYFWIWYVWNNLPNYPREAVVFSFGIFLASSLGLLLNIYMKVSMHAIALGTALSFLCLLSFNYDVNFGLYLSIAFLIAGMVASSRLLLGQHSPNEIYWGLATGLVAIVIANMVQ